MMDRVDLTVVAVVVMLGHIGAVAGRCPGLYDEVGGSCFHVLTAKRDFEAAREDCHHYGGDLAIVDDCSLQASLSTYLKTLGLQSYDSFWVGGSDLLSEGRWEWLDGSPVTMGAPYWARWHPDQFEPEPSGGTGENCAVLSVGGGYYFQDIDCDEHPGYAPLCQAPTLDGSTGSCESPYEPVGGSSCLLLLASVDVTWPDARALCQHYGGDLAIIDDCHLMEAVISFTLEQGADPAGGLWIGGSDEASEGTWTWVDGSNMQMGAPFWGLSGDGVLEPDDFEGGEDCLLLTASDQFRFNDYDCDGTRYPLCQTSHIKAGNGTD